MIDIIPFFMLPVAFVLMFLGIQVAFSMMITAVLFGLYIFGDRVIFQFIEKIEDISSNFVFAAIPLFVFMGAILEKSGIADKLFEAIHIWTRRLPGGLALATVIMCIIFAASSGVIGATESVVGLLTIPIMLRYKYNKAMISGTICAGGSLGTIIPPSVVAVVMGPSCFGMSSTLSSLSLPAAASPCSLCIMTSLVPSSTSTWLSLVCLACW